jgi:hypothetical protein
MTFLDRDKYGMYKNFDKRGPGPFLMGAGTLLGEEVVNADEEYLGDIKEIMIDMASGAVAYAVLSFGGFLGMGEKLFAVPWQALNLDTASKRFVLDVAKERLKSAPGFNPNAWPDMSDMGWAGQIHTFYGTDPSRSGSMGRNTPQNGMVGGAARGAGASSLGAGHAGGSTGAGNNIGGGGAGSNVSGKPPTGGSGGRGMG